MFISSKGTIYFQENVEGFDVFRKVTKSCEKLIVSSTSTDKVEEVDRIFETSEILRKTNCQTIEFESPAEVEESAEEEDEESTDEPDKPKRGRPAQKAKTEDK